MFTSEQIQKVAEAAGVADDEYFIRNRPGEVVAQAASLGVINEGLNLWVSGKEFLVTLDVNGVRLASDALDIQFLDWAGFMGVKAVRGVLTVVEREGRALQDRLDARFTATPF
ncbi:hypothetical protein [Streptomyces sp. 5-10]|uniref:hypothetical protein n=1 Tax=Streptomyces sp. 5-10 TaxID=878925 RepID=UPI00168B3EEB|nr:hypothetical protein [Streptomyces sp. 5-10]MBD3004633.1 hypothetical protein [Streptomyces sp. 5-10]